MPNYNKSTLLDKNNHITYAKKLINFFIKIFQGIILGAGAILPRNK